jgi:hypothetical protein
LMAEFVRRPGLFPDIIDKPLAAGGLFHSAGRIRGALGAWQENYGLVARISPSRAAISEPACFDLSPGRSWCYQCGSDYGKQQCK